MLHPNFKPFPNLTTKRLLLRRIVPSDGAAIFDLRSSPEVMKFIDRPLAKTREDADLFIQAINEALEVNSGITWAIALKANPNELIGTIGYWRLVKEHARAEIGYLLHPAYWRKGIMREAMLRLLDFAFDDMQLHSIEAHINPDNTASAALLQATGFVQEAYFKEAYYYKGQFLDTAVYSRLKL